MSSCTEIADVRSAQPLKRIWVNRSPVAAASTVALSLGWLAEDLGRDGIEVASYRESSPQLVPADAELQARTTFREGGNILALSSRTAGADTRVIGLTWIDERQAIIVRPGARIFEPGDMKGLRVAVPGYAETRGRSVLRGMSLHGVENALAIAGLTMADVTAVEVPSPRVDFAVPDTLYHFWAAGLQELAAGRVDAVYVKGPTGAEAAERLGLVTGIDLDVYPSRLTRINNGTPRPITVHSHMIENHFDIVVRFLQQTLRAADWASSNPPELRRIIADDALATEASVIAAYRNDFYRNLHPDTSRERVDTLRTQAEYLHDRGFLDRAADIDAWIDPRPLQEAYRLRALGRAA